MSSLDAHFGVKGAESVDVRIDWPSGRTSELLQLGVNQIHHIIEPES